MQKTVYTRIEYRPVHSILDAAERNLPLIRRERITGQGIDSSIEAKGCEVNGIEHGATEAGDKHFGMGYGVEIKSINNLVHEIAAGKPRKGIHRIYKYILAFENIGWVHTKSIVRFAGETPVIIYSIRIIAIIATVKVGI